MNRRNFLRAILGTAAATALPSEVWPFRKIFVPHAIQLWGPEAITVHGPLDIDLAYIEAIELESFAKEIPELISRDSMLYNLLKRPGAMAFSRRPVVRIPMQLK